MCGWVLLWWMFHLLRVSRRIRGECNGFTIKSSANDDGPVLGVYSMHGVHIHWADISRR